MEVIRVLWDNIFRASPTPLPWMAILQATLGLTLVAIPQIWRRGARPLVTITHELGHALAGALLGMRVAGFSFHGDTSGETQLQAQRGFFGSMGRLLATAAGYPFPALAGVLLVLATSNGHAPLALGIAGVLCLFCLLLVRNLHGLGLMLLVNAGIWTAAYFAPGPILAWAMGALAWLLLFGGFKVLVELLRTHMAGERGDSDIAVLTRWVPVLEWVVFGGYFLGYLAALVAMVALL